MASTSETGHAKNVDNLGDLIAGITTFGTKYNPSNPLLIVKALNEKAASARASINAVNTATIQYANASNKRENAFKPLNSLVTRSLNAMRSSASADNTDATLTTLARKIYGTRATSTKAAAKKAAEKKDAAEQAAAATPEAKVKAVSVSQRSYDSQADNLDRYLEALANTPEYGPNEEELKLASLKAFAADIRKLNTECTAAAYTLDSARTTRNAELYAPNTGVVDLAIAAKAYVKSAFGATSAEYKRIASIEIRKPKL
jgi:catabolite regulation protein CreA